MPPLRSLETTLKQLNLENLSSTSNHFADDKARWENELARLISIKPSRGREVTDPSPSALHPSTPITLPDTIPQTGSLFAPIQHTIWSTTAPNVTPTSSPPATPQLNPESEPFPPGLPPTLHYPASIPKTTHRAWLNMRCPIAFSPCSPRATWPWPSWVCDAFEKGDVLYYTVGPDATPYVNIREQRKNLWRYFHKAFMNEGVVDRGDGEGRCGNEDVDMEGKKLEPGKLSVEAEIEGTESIPLDSKMDQSGAGKQECESSEEENQWRARTKLALDRSCAKATAEWKKRAQANKRFTQSGDEMTGLQKKRLELAEAIKPAAKKVRLNRDASRKESREEGMGEWEVLDGAVEEEDWVDVSNERTAGDRWAMVRPTVLSGGEGEGEGDGA